MTPWPDTHIPTQHLVEDDCIICIKRHSLHGNFDEVLDAASDGRRESGEARLVTKIDAHAR